MANTITKTTLLNGSRNIVVLVSVQGDASGDETDTLLIDRSSFGSGTETVVEKIEGALSTFTARLTFDATTDLIFSNLPDTYFCFDFKDIGGISSNAAGAGAAGDILITTTGLGAEHGAFVIHMRKS